MRLNCLAQTTHLFELHLGVISIRQKSLLFSCAYALPLATSALHVPSLLSLTPAPTVCYKTRHIHRQPLSATVKTTIMEDNRKESVPGNVPQNLGIQVMAPADFQGEKIPFRRATTDSSLAMRLQGIEDWSSELKSATLTSIADDVATTLMLIGKHSLAGILDHTHTQRISDVIDIVLKTDERLARRKIRRLRKRNRERKQAYRLLASATKEVLEKYDTRVETLKRRVQNLRGEVRDLKEEQRLHLEHIHYLKMVNSGDYEQSDPSAEERKLESPQDEDMAGLTDEDGEWEEYPETEL